MTIQLRYGADAPLELDFEPDALVAACAVPRGQTLTDVSQAVADALESPLNFPALAQSVVPGDTVVLTLESGVPSAARIVTATIERLLASGVSPESITLLQLADRDGGDCDPLLGGLDSGARRKIQRRVHDPANREAISYLAASSDSKPIYINRAIHDADLVIPIGCLRGPDTPGYHGAHAGLFPAFSDAQSIERYRAGQRHSAPERKRLDNYASEVAWLLGARFTIQVVPAARDELLHVLAGDIDAVFRLGSQLYLDAWACDLSERARLVVAGIDGDETEQTWDNLARALAAAGEAVEDGGDIVICTHLASRLGLGLQQMSGCEDLDTLLRRLGKHAPDDALIAFELIHALSRGKVYLLSRLHEEVVEELGMRPITAQQMPRLVARHDSCIVLANAQYAAPRVAWPART